MKCIQNTASTLSLGLAMMTSLSACQGGVEGGTWTLGRKFDRVLVIVLENQDYSSAIADPYLKDLAARGALLSNFNGLAHPSYSNYLDMVGGHLFTTVLDAQITTDDPSIADTLETAGLDWKAYAETYSGGCDLTSMQGDYARKHVPFLSFKSIQDDPKRCAKVVPADQFQADVSSGTLANYMFYTPNLKDDGHDTDLPTASTWLKGFLEPLLANPEFMKRTLIEVTFDESKTYTNNHIYTTLLGPAIQAGTVSNVSYDHFNLLKTIEGNFGLGTLASGDGEASPILDVWVPETSGK